MSYIGTKGFHLMTTSQFCQEPYIKRNWVCKDMG